MSLRAPFPWFGDPLSYALELVRLGVIEIDGRGRVWRTAIFNHGRFVPVERRRAENPGNKGYLRVTLWQPHSRRLAAVMAHNLVWTVKVGPIPEGKELNHKNLKTDDNRPSNLEPVTKEQNIQHSYANGRRRPWSDSTEWRPGRERLAAETVAQIRAVRAGGQDLKTIAAAFGLSTTHVHRLCQKGGGM